MGIEMLSTHEEGLDFVGDIIPEMQTALLDMVKKGKRNEVIVQYVKRDYGMEWSVRTLKRRLRTLGITRHGNVMQDDVIKAVQELKNKGNGQFAMPNSGRGRLREWLRTRAFHYRVLVKEMEGPSKNIGYRHMQQRLRMRHDLPVKKNEVYQAMQLVDPIGIQARKKRVCTRTDYVSVGSNWIWHIDGHDKLKKYGFAFHVAIDGFSRKILWCHVDSFNNDPKYIAKYYYDFVSTTKNGMVETTI